MERGMSEQRDPLRRSVNDEDQMNLPEGKTCGDCVHCRRCTLMFGHIPADESCDWSPSRFREAVPTTVSA
ncbi:hypothetical protein FQZ97_613840 [compost metagenome]